MTDPDPLERYFDDFGARLSRAAGKPANAAHPHRGQRFALVSALAVGAIVATTLALGTSGDRLDPIAEARAALAAPGEIIYMKVTSTSQSDDMTSVLPPQTTEQWSTLDPPQWRFVQTFPPPGSSGGTIGGSGGPISISGRVEVAYGNGERRTYLAERDTLTVARGYDDRSAGRVPSVLPTGSGDVQTDLRALLGRDATDEGERQAGGRTVRRLTSVNDRAGARWRFAYDVDAVTYEPIGGTATVVVDRGGRASLTHTTRIHVDAYERIPLNAKTAKLLEIQTTPQTKVTVQQLRDRERQMREQCRKRADGDAVCLPAVLSTRGTAP